MDEQSAVGTPNITGRLLLIARANVGLDARSLKTVEGLAERVILLSRRAPKRRIKLAVISP
jgi:hypothetical protein